LQHLTNSIKLVEVYGKSVIKIYMMMQNSWCLGLQSDSNFNWKTHWMYSHLSCYRYAIQHAM